VPSTSATVLEVLRAFLANDAPPKPWGVAYSGGRDSGVLLWALAQVGGPGAVVALHVDHGWRPRDERQAETALVGSWCRQLGVALRQFPPPLVPVTTEVSARQYRYRCFQSFLSEFPASRVFLGHHADDQAETIFLRLVQGRSWQGLGGMAPRRDRYLRPFLGLRRSILSQVAISEDIPFHEDSTNQGDRPARNYLRQRVFPLLEDRFPRVVEALGDFGRVWNSVSPDPSADPLWQPQTGGFRIDAAIWDQWSPLVRQAQLLALVSKLGPGGRISRRFLEAVVEEGRSRSARGAGWHWSRSEGSVLWRQVAQGCPKEYLILANGPGTWDLGTYTLNWAPGNQGEFEVPGVDPTLPWTWRSAVPGMRWISAEGEWDRSQRRHRLGALGPDRCALVCQGGLLCAVVDPSVPRVVWTDSPGGKLHKSGIFVTLRSVT
jgi:tRNA(Ile)-lysidine synthetase-like protein